MIETNREAYQTAKSRHTKTSITRSIEDMVRGCGGRFLKFNETSGQFEEISDAETHEKISHALRSAKDKSRTPQRQKRTVVKYIPTPAEEERFQRDLAVQKRMYELFLQRKDYEPEAENPDVSESEILDMIMGLT